MSREEIVAAKQEGELLRSLHHHNIVRFHDSFRDRGRQELCIVMEYANGGDLGAKIELKRRCVRHLRVEAGCANTGPLSPGCTGPRCVSPKTT